MQGTNSEEIAPIFDSLIFRPAIAAIGPFCTTDTFS